MSLFKFYITTYFSFVFVYIYLGQLVSVKLGQFRVDYKKNGKFETDT